MSEFFGGTYEFVDGVSVLTNVFPVESDWEGYRFNGYCKVSKEEAAEFFAS